MIKMHPVDNLLAALLAGGGGWLQGYNYTLRYPISVKHKFSIQPISAGSEVMMYGVWVKAKKQYTNLRLLSVTDWVQ